MTSGLFTGPVLLAAGGTGGHMFPAQALAEELRRRDHEVVLITDARGKRYTDNFPAQTIIEIPAANPSARGAASKLNAALKLSSGLMRSLQEIRGRKPIAAIGFGGYPSLPAMQGARLLKTPYGLHEQNSQLGRANRFLAKNAYVLAHGFPLLNGVPPGLKTQRREVGNPVRDAVREHAGAPFTAPASGHEFRLLITGGSQGASVFSDVPVQAIAALPNHLRGALRVVHQVRENDLESVNTAYQQAGISAEIAPFFTDLPAKIAQSHLIIARSGASTVTEIATIGRPCVFVPLGIAMDDHQTMNARVLSEADAAIILPENKFTPSALHDCLQHLLTNPAQVARMAQNTSGRVKTAAASEMADLVEEMVERA